MLTHPLLRLAPLALALAACSPQPEPAADNAAAPASAPVTDQAVAPLAAAATEEVRAPDLSPILAGAQRTDEERARDQYRHPAETLAFFGITPGMTVVEITPGNGWYTAVLGPLLKDRGQYVGAVRDESLPGQPGYVARGNAAIEQRFAEFPDAFGGAKLLRFDPAAPAFGEPGSADAVLTFRNAHNWVGDGNADAYFRAFFDVLKSGGTLGVVDHRAAPGEATDGKTGYVTEQQVIDLAVAAGFRLVDQSEINANPQDDHDHPKGVWTLPPTFALGDEDKDVYAAIGESDRMTLKFVKP